MENRLGSPTVDTRWGSALHPFIYEINTWAWLDAVSRAEGRPIDLGSIPGDRWAGVADLGVDAVWLMGVWERSAVGVEIALANPELTASFDASLPDWRTEDVVGSPYCIRDYVVDDRLGGTDALAVARQDLAARGLGLILDFVPNHVAPDHPWTTDHPERFVRGTPDDLLRDPAAYIEVDDRVLARGKDPYFPPWPDVVQLNAFSPALRAAVVETLRTIADQCDGVRCDMAMLAMNDVFERTWGPMAGERPADDYWATVITAVHETHPAFRFLAEAYWDLEWALQQQGFDSTYDKRLYDRLLHEGAEDVRLHLLADHAYQDRLVRFIENHDEPRAASAFGTAREKAAAVATLTQTGTRLVHHGQIEGWRVHLPVFLGRYPSEPTNPELAEFYRSLLATLSDPTFHRGRWELCERSGWPGNDTYESLVAWCWDDDHRWLVVVNLSGDGAAAHVHAPWEDLRGRQCRLTDPTHGVAFERTGDDLGDGLYVELGPWQWHLFRVELSEGDE